MARSGGGAGLGLVGTMVIAGLAIRACWPGEHEGRKEALDAVKSVGVECSTSDPRNGGRVLVNDVLAPVDLEVDASGIYWSAVGMGNPNGFIRKLAHGATEWITLAEKSPVGDIVVDDSHVYWISGQRILRVSKLGGRVEPVAWIGSGGSRIIADADSIYWVQELGRHRVSLRAASKANKKVRELGTFPEELLGQNNISFSSDSIVWTGQKSKEQYDYVVRSVSKQGGEIVEHGPGRVAGASDGTIFWSDGQKLFKKAAGGSPVEFFEALGFFADWQIVPRGEVVFVAESEWRNKRAHPPRIWRIPIGEGCAEIVANPPYKSDNRFVVYDGRVYWPDRSEGKIYVGLK